MRVDGGMLFLNSQNIESIERAKYRLGTPPSTSLLMNDRQTHSKPRTFATAPVDDTIDGPGAVAKDSVEKGTCYCVAMHCSIDCPFGGHKDLLRAWKV